MLELEAKLRVSDPAVFATLMRCPTLAGFTLTPAHVEQQHSSYLDTRDQRVAAQQATLRVRTVGIRQIGTVKRQRVDGHVHPAIRARDEWEVVLAAGAHPLDWPDSPARHAAVALVSATPLIRLFTVSTHRQHITLLRGTLPILDLCLDTGHISVGEQHSRFCELEAECIGTGTLADLAVVVPLLIAQLGLVPEEQSKKARGYALRRTVANTSTALREEDVVVPAMTPRSRMV